MTTASVVLLLLFFVFLISSTPIAIALGLATFVYFYYYTVIPLTQVPDQLVNALNTFPLMAIPFFIFAANIMSQGGISRKLDRGSKRCGRGASRGGLAMTAVISCIFFAAISGFEPGNRCRGGHAFDTGHGPKVVTDRNFSTGTRYATSGSLGILIPPSIPLIVYGIAAEHLDRRSFYSWVSYRAFSPVSYC